MAWEHIQRINNNSKWLEGDHAIVIRKHRKLGMEKLPLRSFGTTDEYEGSIPSLVTNKLFELKINDNIALLKTM